MDVKGEIRLCMHRPLLQGSVVIRKSTVGAGSSREEAGSGSLFLHRHSGEILPTERADGVALDPFASQYGGGGVGQR